MIGIEQDDAGSGITGLDLTPLIDIIFIVLVFLLLTANTQLFSLPIEVPTESTSELQALSQDKHLTINVMSSQPFWALNGEEYQDFAQFEQAFISSFTAEPDTKVIIAADKEAQVQPLMTLLALMQRQQISNTQILMEP
ncbi:outer membrane transport energization protein ExbD [Shewanella psychrophila]|uniref:Outer membrane transport energization protein ExbD n=1 Tax=Shewanella psychrophila TaxID=225848 RepID=A0A1S6HWV6_9GAMM|nr:biopolymer transporter ExbD [Shewanella psychrophila]AQS39981.1 outer membrane transport energization protein ExbD [Shewanella psychrophila]